MARRKKGIIAARRLREIVGEKAVNAGYDALKKGAEDIVKLAKVNCPVKTGRLRDSIHAVPRDKAKLVKIVADAENDKGYPYGKIVEFSPKINKPFLYPAIDALKYDIHERVKEAIRQALTKGG